MVYVAKKSFNAYLLGKVKKGQEVEFKKSWFDAGLIEEARGSFSHPKPADDKDAEDK